MDKETLMALVGLGSAVAGGALTKLIDGAVNLRKAKMERLQSEEQGIRTELRQIAEDHRKEMQRLSAEVRELRKELDESREERYRLMEENAKLKAEHQFVLVELSELRAQVTRQQNVPLKQT